MIQSVTELNRKIREVEVTPLELHEDLRERIEKYDQDVRSYVTLNENAEKLAGRMTDLARRGDLSGPLHGIPVSVKDLIETKGLRTTYGSAHYSENVSDANAQVVENLLDEGSYVIGKTNTHEFALGVVTSPTANPHDLSRIPGGSSGGSAAAIAAGLSVFALGSDTGGSIRIPASMCGITGLKPTYGIISTEGVFPESWSLDHVGPMVRFAEDLPIVMNAMGSRIENRSIEKPLKVGLISGFMESACNEVRNTVRSATQKMESAGLIEVSDFTSTIFGESLELHEVIDTSEIAAIHRDQYYTDPSIYLESSIREIESGLSRSAAEYIMATRSRDAMYEKFLKDMRGYDLLISPTLPKTAPTLNELQEIGGYVAFQSEFNYLGVPAMSIPCGFVNDLPVGLQLIGRRYDDSAPISLAIEFQNITDWHLDIPTRFR